MTCVFHEDGTVTIDRWKRVKESGFPVDLYPFQQKCVQELAPLDRSALWLDVGTGKTVTSLAIAKYKILDEQCEQILIIVPPVLLHNWSRNVLQVFGDDQVIYQGTPAKRKKLSLDHKVVIVGLPIFKRDYQRFFETFFNRKVFIILDESQSIKNPASQNFKSVRDFSATQQIRLLSGTPMSVPIDAYGQIKIKSPTIYSTLHQWCSIHVEETDFISGKPTKYCNLGMLTHNLMLCAERVLKEDVLKDLPELTYSPIYYDLEPAHLALYQKMAEEQMLILEDGRKLDATNVSALFQTLQQIPCGGEHFSEGKVRSTIFDIIDMVLDELAGKKLVIFCHYRRTVGALVDYLAPQGAKALFGGTAANQRQGIIDNFVEDPECKVLILQYVSGGAGIDSLQHVCRDILTVELPYRAADLRQAVARVHRNGQKNAVNCRIAIANKTLQVRFWEYVQDNDSLVNSVLRGATDIRAILAGS